MKRKFFIAIMCIMIVLSMISFPVYANPLALVYEAESVLAGLLTGYGYSNLNTTDIANTYNELSPELQLQLAYIAQNNIVDRGDGFAICNIDQDTLNAFNEWFNENYADGTLPAYSYQWDGGQLPYPSPNYTRDINGYIDSIVSVSTYQYQVVIAKQGTGPSAGKLLIGTEVYESDSPFYAQAYLYNDNEYRFIKNDNEVIKHVSSGDPVIDTISNLTSLSKSTGYTNPYYWSNVPLVIYDFNMVAKGNLFYQSIPAGYAYNDYYSPDNYPLPVKLGVPFVVLPTNDAPDTNVQAPPDNSIDNPISLETVLAGYGSIDNFFEQGGTITLSDGTVIGKLPDIARSAEPVLENTGTGTVEGDVSGIKSLVQSISKTLSAIRTAVLEFFAISDFSLNLDPLKVDFKSVFPFCIPFDLANLVGIFAASPSDFTFNIKLDTQYWQVDHTVDLSPFRVPIIFFRYCVIATFIWILISQTRNLIKW